MLIRATQYAALLRRIRDLERLLAMISERLTGVEDGGLGRL